MQALRELHKADPEKYPSWMLAQRFKISPEAVRRVLKSNWTMSEDRKEEKVMRERRTRIERMKRMREEEMHQMVRAGIKLKVHPDDRLDLT
jgi:Neugrin